MSTDIRGTQIANYVRTKLMQKFMGLPIRDLVYEEFINALATCYINKGVYAPGVPYGIKLNASNVDGIGVWVKMWEPKKPWKLPIVASDYGYWKNLHDTCTSA